MSFRRNPLLEEVMSTHLPDIVKLVFSIFRKGNIILWETADAFDGLVLVSCYFIFLIIGIKNSITTDHLVSVENVVYRSEFQCQISRQRLSGTDKLDACGVFNKANHKWQFSQAVFCSHSVVWYGYYNNVNQKRLESQTSVSSKTNVHE